MLSSLHFLCLPLRFRPWTVPCRTVLASPDDRVTYPYHFSLRLFTEVRRSSYGSMAFPIQAFTSWLVMWSLYWTCHTGHLAGSPAFVELGLLVGSSTALQHVSQGWICSDKCMYCHSEIEVADQTFCVTQSQHTDTGSTSPSADPITLSVWQGSHWSTSFYVTGMTWPGKRSMAQVEPRSTAV